MAIISQGTWDNIPKEEKEKIIKEYNYVKSSQDHDCGFRCKELELLFGKENLQLKIRTWKDCQKMNEDSNFFIRIDDNLELPDKIRSKSMATLKIAKLIELGYGGMVTEEEWCNNNIEKWGIVWRPRSDTFSILTFENNTHFITFHTQQQAEEFMSYPENVELVEQYNML